MAIKTLGELLGELPSGAVDLYSPADCARYIREYYFDNDDETDRRNKATLRLDLYHDRGDAQIDELLVSVFKSEEVLALRRAFIPYSQFQNVTKRVVNEISTVYAESAARRVKSGDKRYQQLLLDVKQDRVLRKASRYVNLLNECFVMFRVRQSDLRPTLDVITPDRFYAIAHPLEPTRMVAIVIHTASTDAEEDDPHWTVWSDAEVFRLNKFGELISSSYMEHGYGSIPGILVHREIPDSALLDSTSGGDLISAHKAVALLNVLMLKEQKSGTKVPYVVGDLGQTAMGQSMESENLIHLEEGVAPGTMDLGADPRTYIDAVRSVIKQVAANYGIPESVFDLSYQASSGFEIELKRTGLREKRRDQIMDWRDAERELVQIQSAITTQALGPDASFAPDKWQIDFGEVETPRDPMQMLAYFEKLRAMTLGNSVQFAMKLNPEFTEKEAALWVQKNIDVETVRVSYMKELSRLNGSVNSEPGEPTPEENGDNNGEEEAEGM